mmetsp:Transcript_132443/g.264269  ORF Transcript_132443/g.264269 Transcript_132443/m.264269 type:complete len:191 (-) Transcript_132443:129-701(-)
MAAKLWRCSTLGVFAWFALYALPAAAEKSRQPVIIHRKLRRSALRAKQTVHTRPALLATHVATRTQKVADMQDSALLIELAQESPSVAGAITEAATSGNKDIEVVQEGADTLSDNFNEEHDMLMTQILANGESLNVIKALADTVTQMKGEVDKLEAHEKLCRKRVADLEASQADRADDDRVANSVEVVEA